MGGWGEEEKKGRCEKSSWRWRRSMGGMGKEKVTYEAKELVGVANEMR